LHRTATRAALGFGAIIKNDAKHKQEQLTRKKEEAVSRPRFDVFVVCVVLYSIAYDFSAASAAAAARSLSARP